VSYSRLYSHRQHVSNTDPLLPLFAPISVLPGVGPKVAPLLARAVGGERVLDLLFHLPEGLIDRTARPSMADAEDRRIATVEIEVVRTDAPVRRSQPWRVVVTDGSAFGELVFFSPAWLGACQSGARLVVSGKVERFEGQFRMVHPDHLLPAARASEVPGLEPVWGLTAGLFPRQVTRAMAGALQRIPELPEWHDPALLRRERWPAFIQALRALHVPEAPPGEKPRLRLAYDELLAHQLSVQWLRARIRNRPGRAIEGHGRLRARALARFGHEPTPSQLQVVAEIDADMAAPRRMLRLLQGDVGAGKTLVALLAMLRAAEAGSQAALMAPTEVLAQQHHRTLSALSPVPVALLTGSVKGGARRQTLAAIASGAAKLVVGTHALFQEQVAYHDLALAVIDEQHRFGVDQRLLLGGKGRATDVLVMTATPIPRTLLLAQWGEMEVSRLTGKPAGRHPVRTSIHSLSSLDDVVDGIERQIRAGGRVYWVCPLVEESEALDLAAAEARVMTLRRRFGAAVGLAHGRQDPAVRDAALADFAAGRIGILVATTVVEVGVDVPEATVIVIEHAERFGLAQLHQLRGRVGRGTAASFCLLLHEDGLTDTARRRLLLLRDTEDGFAIADEDFRLRGGGDLLGTRQSGLPGWRIADPVEHEQLLHMAAQDAAIVLARDPGLVTERGRGLRTLLQLFDRVSAMRTLRSG
jgi:ATP-dependent DNA helicase RecG